MNIKELSNEELGRQIANAVGICTDETKSAFTRPAYLCESLDSIAVAEAFIIEKGLGKAYTHNLQKLYDDEIENGQNFSYGGRDLATRSALTRATAVWMTIQNI